MSKDNWSKKNSVKSNVAISKKEMEYEWDVEVLCVIEEDELALMVMMEEHINYENDWIIDSGCSNHTTDDRSGAIESGWHSKKEVLLDFDNIEEILS